MILKSKTYTSKADYTYWKEKGWLEQKYYYETKLPIGSTFIEKIMNQIVKITMIKLDEVKILHLALFLL